MVAPAERIEPTLTFENIEDVLSMTRRVAEENFRRHLQAVIAAQGEEARASAIEALSKSAEAAALADSALKSAISANTDFRASTVEAIKGNEVGATSGFKRSGMGMENGAESLERFADYIPQSKFFAAAVSAVQKIDGYVAGVEVSAQEKVAAFARGLKAFANGMKSFGKEVAATPAKIKEAVVGKVVGAAEATVIAAAIAELTVRQQVRRIGAAVDSFVGAVKDGVSTRVAAAKHFDARVRESAWDKIDRFANAVDAKVDLVERHAKATAGVASDLVGVIGGSLRKLSDDIAVRYAGHSAAVAHAQASRKAASVAEGKPSEAMLAAYGAVRSPIAAALDKSNVIALGTAPLPQIVSAAEMAQASDGAKLKAAVADGTPTDLRVLLERNPSANMVFALPQPERPQLHMSVLEFAKSSEVVRLLLAAGANPNPIATVDMAPPLSSMMIQLPEAERADAAVAMLEHGADPSAQSGAWLTPLAATMTTGNVEMTKLLLDAGAKVSDRDVVALIYCTQQKVDTSYTIAEEQIEQRTAERIVKALFAADRPGVEAALKNEKIAALVETMPYMKAIIENAAPAELEAPRVSAKLG
jgi:hypothetical protein